MPRQSTTPLIPKRLHFDLIVDNILPKLPSKSLIRFSSACKQWNSAIKSPSFIAAHSAAHRNSSKIIFSCGEKVCSVSEDENTIETIFHVGDLKTTDSSIFRIHRYYGSCNGLIYFHIIVLVEDNNMDHQYLVCNPWIRKTRRLSRQHEPNKPPEEWEPIRCIGIGFHEASQDHRAVWITYAVYFDTQRCGEIPAKVEVYSARADAWHGIDANPVIVGFKEWCIYLNGATHWLATTRIISSTYTPEPESLETILFFDFQNERFGDIPLPEELLEYTNEDVMSFNEFEGSLGALLFNKISCSSSTDEFNFPGCVLWVMTEYGVPDSWSQIYVFSGDSIPRNCLLDLNGFNRNGIVMYTKSYEEEEETRDFVLLNVHTKKERRIGGSFEALRVYDAHDNLFLFYH